VVRNYGADSLRLYEMFMGPLEATKPWSEQGVKGVFGFLGRVYRFFNDPGNLHDDKEDPEVLKVLHQTIKKVGQDVEALRFNTAISQMMIFTNLCIKKGLVSRHSAGTFIKVLAPFAPHISEEIWEALGNAPSIADKAYPEFDEELLKEDEFEYPVSFNAKLRFKLELPLSMQEDDLREAVINHEIAQKWLKGGVPRKIIIVKGRIINVVL